MAYALWRYEFSELSLHTMIAEVSPYPRSGVGVYTIVDVRLATSSTGQPQPSLIDHPKWSGCSLGLIN